MAVEIPSELPQYPHAVLIGGGHGPGPLRRGLIEYTPYVTSVEPVIDTGGSGGRIRRERKTLGIGIGDITAAMVDQMKNSPLATLLGHRYQAGTEKGHRVVNLVLMAAYERNNGELLKAIEEVGELGGMVGRVLPVTLEPGVNIHTTFSDGRRVRREHRLDEIEEGGPIVRSSLSKPARALDAVLEEIYKADFITLGPGSFVASLKSQLYADGVLEALRQSKAIKQLWVNIANKNGEHGYRTSDYAREIAELMKQKIDFVVFPTIPEQQEHSPEVEKLEQTYEQHQQDLVELDADRTLQYAHRVKGFELVRIDWITEGRKRKPVFRHMVEESAEAALSAWIESTVKDESFMLVAG